MRTSFRRVAVVLLTAGMLAPAWALPISLDTTWLDANAKLSLSPVAQQTLALTGISVAASGNTSNLGGGAFNLPVSELAVDIGIFPPTLSVLTADVQGASLTFSNSITKTAAKIANLSLNYQDQTIFGDLVVGGVSKHFSIFSFDVVKPLSFSLAGGISVNLNLGNIHFTDVGATSFAAALNIPSALVPTFTAINFGTLDAKVVPWFRAAVPSVPEPVSALMFFIGLAGLAAVTRRARV